VDSQFSVQASRTPAALVLAVGGELDLSSSRALEEELERALASDAPCVIVDLRDVEFIDSTGLGVLVKANQQAVDGGRRFGLVQGGAQVQRLLSLTGLSERLTVAGTPEEIIGGA
jgi:anti-anti-sigma factor